VSNGAFYVEYLENKRVRSNNIRLEIERRVGCWEGGVRVTSLSFSVTLKTKDRDFGTHTDASTPFAC
jgi:hypothetical protein